MRPAPEELADPVRRRELDRVMILSPDDWPRWPRLPLKARSPKRGMHVTELCAFIEWPAHQGNVVFPLRIGLGTIYRPLSTRVYETIDELLDDWTVD